MNKEGEISYYQGYITNKGDRRMKLTLDEWIIKGEVGVSSKTMWAVLKGIEVNDTFGDKPYDPADFGRCYKFAKQCGLTNDDLNKISTILPYWEPYIKNWGKLCEMYEENENNNWTNYEEIGMYEFMQLLLKESEIILKTKN